MLLGALTLFGDGMVAAHAAARVAALGAAGVAAQPLARHARTDPRADVVQLEQLPRPLANTVVFSTDVVVVGSCSAPRPRRSTRFRPSSSRSRMGSGASGTRLLYPALAEYEGSATSRPSTQASAHRPARRHGGRRSSSRCRCSSFPEQLIEAWVGEGYGESSAVLALLALVALVHQPIFLLDAVPDRAGATARDRADARRRLSGERRALGRAGRDGWDLGCRSGDAARRTSRCLLYIVPVLVAPAAGSSGRAGARDRCGRSYRHLEPRWWYSPGSASLGDWTRCSSCCRSAFLWAAPTCGLARLALRFRPGRTCRRLSASSYVRRGRRPRLAPPGTPRRSSGALGHARDRELLEPALPTGFAECRRRARGRPATSAARSRSALTSPASTRSPVWPSATTSGNSADAGRDDGQRGEHRLEQDDPEALPARGVHEDVGPFEPVADLGAAGEGDGVPSSSSSTSPGRGLERPGAEDREPSVGHGSPNEREGAQQRRVVLLLDQPADGQRERRARGIPAARGSAARAPAAARRGRSGSSRAWRDRDPPPPGTCGRRPRSRSAGGRRGRRRGRRSGTGRAGSGRRCGGWRRTACRAPWRRSRRRRPRGRDACAGGRAAPPGLRGSRPAPSEG